MCLENGLHQGALNIQEPLAKMSKAIRVLRTPDHDIRPGLDAKSASELVLPAELRSSLLRGMSLSRRNRPDTMK
ncbi:hypothetical protein IFM47457_01694 [Aspergillus lentulus]|nr:hypothetical protein IFM47457_01694 [Aspergillus lentulus]